MSEIQEFLRRQLNAGEWTIGQIRVRPDILLRHIDDPGQADFETFIHPQDARELAKYDGAGNYRPLKTAPNLRRGWELRLACVEDLRLALDFFYPAAIGTWLAFQRGELRPVSFRQTVGRQTGMYRVTQLIRDEQAAGLVSKVCVEGCLRLRLWEINDAASPSMREPVSGCHDIPILCGEACNLLVAACRPLAKGNLPKPDL